MKRPDPNPNSRKIPARLAPLKTEQALAAYAALVRYIGSSEHKSAPWHDIKPAARKDACLCPTYITRDQATQMLKAGILAGNISEDFDGELPRRVWYKGPQGIFEARLTDRSDKASGKLGGYKGWPEVPEKLPTKPRAVRETNEI